MNVPLLDLKAQYATIRAEIDPVVKEIFESQCFINGPEVIACEESVAKYSNCAFGCGTSSGTDALLLALMNEGIGLGDEVITTPYTFFATAGSIARTGAKPVFIDIDPATFNINPALIEGQITENTRAIMPVHLYGQMADMDPIIELAQTHNLVIIEDAAQAIGAEYKGKRAGSIGDYGCFSFFPSKNLGGAGDGGMIVSNDEAKAQKLKIMRNHGMHKRYHHKFIGGNFRLDALQAAVARIKLRHLDEWSAARQFNAKRYNQLFETYGLKDTKVTTPPIHTDRHIFNQYVIRVPQRDELVKFLRQKEIGVAIYYPVSLDQQECFRDLDCADCPESRKAARETVALPICPEISDAQADYVVESIREFYA